MSQYTEKKSMMKSRDKTSLPKLPKGCKFVPNFTGYAADKLGNIWTCKNGGRGRSGFSNWRKLRPTKYTKCGHLGVTLCKDGKGFKIGAHSVVLITFDRPRVKGEEARHLDGNPRNNRLDNLCWGTSRQNRQDAYKHGTAFMPRNEGEDAPIAKLSNDDVRNIRRRILNGEKIADLAREFHVHWNTIYKANKREHFSCVE